MFDPKSEAEHRIAAAKRRLRGVDVPTDAAAGSTLATAVGLDALVYVAVRYAPEQLRLLGASPLLIGLFAALGLAFALFPTSTLPRWLAALGAAVGLFAWTLAAPLDGVGLSAPGWVLVGLVPLGLWVASPGATAGPESAPFARHLPTRAGNYPLVTVGAVAFAAVVLAAGSALAGLRITTALGAAAGAVVAVAALGGEDSLDPREWSLPATSVPSLRGVVSAVPVSARSLVLGDALVRVALALVSAFVVVTVTTRLDSAAVLGARLTPGAAFGALLAVELAVGTGTAALGERFAGRFDRRALFCWSVLVAAVFPLLLVALPADALVFAALFAGFGTRFVAVEPRRVLFERALPDPELPDATRFVRDAATVAAPPVGGLLFGVSPVLAFGLATTVAAVGATELLRYCYR